MKQLIQNKRWRNIQSGRTPPNPDSTTRVRAIAIKPPLIHRNKINFVELITSNEILHIFR